MKNYLSLGLRLALFVSFVVAMLAGVNLLTEDVIAERQEKEGQAARQKLLAGTFTKMPEDCIPTEEAAIVTAVYQGEENGIVTGYCFDVTVKGYNSIQMIVGINSDLTITGIQILSQTETPGIGSKAVDESGAFLAQFKGLSSRNLESVTMISGATFSSEGIRTGVESAVRTCRSIVEGKGE